MVRVDIEPEVQALLFDATDGHVSDEATFDERLSWVLDRAELVDAVEKFAATNGHFSDGATFNEKLSWLFDTAERLGVIEKAEADLLRLRLASERS